jgi:hypothetical protein
MPLAYVVPIGNNTCDFCNETPIFKLYPCRNFSLRGVLVFNKDVGTWATCWKCSTFVDAENWSALTERAYQKFIKDHGVPRHSALPLRPQFAETVKLFAEHTLSDN